MKKQIIAGLLAATALLSFGCSGRNAEFGVVDMRAVESEAAVVKTVQEEVTTKGKMNVVRSEAQNKLKASLDTALNEVAKEKGLGAVLIKDAVPQGGVDVTQDVIAKMK